MRTCTTQLDQFWRGYRNALRDTVALLERSTDTDAAAATLREVLAMEAGEGQRGHRLTLTSRRPANAAGRCGQ